MSDNTNVDQNVHLNVHLQNCLPDIAGKTTVNDLQSRTKPLKAPPRKSIRRTFLHCRDSYWFFQRRWPKPFDSTGRAPPLRIALGRIAEPEARRLSLALGFYTQLYFESQSGATMSDQRSSGKVTMSQSSEQLSTAPAAPTSRGRVVAVKVQGKLPGSSNPNDEDQRLTLCGIGATMRILSDIASARSGSAVEQAGLVLIDGVWDAHASAIAQRKTAASAFRSFANQLNHNQIVQRALPIPNPLPLEPHATLLDASPAFVVAPTMLTPDSIEPGNKTTVAPKSWTYEPDAELVTQWAEKSNANKLLTAQSLFSDCIASQITRRKANNGKVQESSIIYPARMWIALVGDKPMSMYESYDLQRFVDLAKFVPPNAEKRFPNLTFAQLVQENRNHKMGAPSRKTMANGWVASVKSIFGHHARRTQGRSPFDGTSVELPRILKAPQKHSAPTIETTNAVFRIGARSSHEVDAFLPLLAFGTGRRIGLLAYLQGSSFRTDSKTGVIFAQVAQTIETPDGLSLTPYKSDESITEFVVPKFVSNTGFVDWAKAKGTDFVFTKAHNAQDPADMVSKRLSRLICSAEAQTGDTQHGKAHGWRGQAEDRWDENSIPDAASRLQVGHALNDIHSRYKSGKLPTPDALRIFHAPPDEGIDLSPFAGLDFNRFDRFG